MTTSENETREDAAHATEAHPLIGWCDEHDSMAELWDDGSVGCHYLTVVETSSNDCRVVPIPPDRLYRGDDTTKERT